MEQYEWIERYRPYSSEGKAPSAVLGACRNLTSGRNEFFLGSDFRPRDCTVMQMRIALLIDGLGTGGAERQAVISAIELARRGEDVELVTYHSENDFRCEIQNHNIKQVPVCSNQQSRVNRIISLSRYLRRAKFDVVHCFNTVPSTYGRLAAKLAGVPTIFGGARGQIRDRPAIRLTNRVLTPGTAGWIVNSARVGDVVVRDFGARVDRVFVVPNGIRPSDFGSVLTASQARKKFGLPGETAVVTMVANLRPVKNHAMFFRMAARLVGTKSSPMFALAGDGPAKVALQRLCDEMGLNEHVRFLGRCNNVGDLLRATTVHVLTSLSEGIPNSVLEACCAGIPTVSTDNGGSTEVILNGETGFIVPKENEEAMAARVLELLHDDDLRIRIGSAAQQMVSKRFSIEALGESLLRIYRTAT